MQNRKLTRYFFGRPTLSVAKELLGKFLVRKIGKKMTTAIITETEAYCGPNDLASHASHGKTKRTEIMFGPPGYAYVYLIYGMYHCFNVVTEKKGYPAAVLIRSVTLSLTTSQVVKLTTCDVVRGPGKLCRHLKIDKTLNNEDLTKSNKIWLEDHGIQIKPSQIHSGKRIGIDYAGKYKHKFWRFYIKN